MSNGPEWMDEDVEGAPERVELAALERELFGALRPFDPPAGFADRVVASAAKPAAAKILAFRSWRLIASGALAASILAGSFVAQDIHERRERERERATEQQFETAMRVTYRALDVTRVQLARAGFRLSR